MLNGQSIALNGLFDAVGCIIIIVL